MKFFDRIIGEEKMDRRQIKTKRAILNAYFELMLEEPKKRISITTLSSKANIDRKTFYLHYSSVQAVHDSIDKAIADFVEQQIKEYTRSDIKFEPYFLLSAVNNFLESDLDFFKKCAECDAFRDSIDKIKQVFYKSLLLMYTDYKHPVTEKKRLALLYVSSGAVDLYVNWLKNGTELTLDELAIFTSRLLSTGIGGIKDEIF